MRVVLGHRHRSLASLQPVLPCCCVTHSCLRSHAWWFTSKSNTVLVSLFFEGIPTFEEKTPGSLLLLFLPRRNTIRVSSTLQPPVRKQLHANAGEPPALPLGAGPSGASLLSVLLKRMASWVATAAMYLQRCYQVTQQDGSASSAYMEGLDPGHRLSSIALARQALQVTQASPLCTPPSHPLPHHPCRPVCPSPDDNTHT